MTKETARSLCAIGNAAMRENRLFTLAELSALFNVLEQEQSNDKTKGTLRYVECGSGGIKPKRHTGCEN